MMPVTNLGGKDSRLGPGFIHDCIGQSDDEFDSHISQPMSHSLPTMAATSGKAFGAGPVC